MTDITLLPGWSLATGSLDPLRSALLERLPQASVHAHELPVLSLATLEQDLTALAESVPPGVLVGWSLGGMLALQLMRRFPDRFHSVVTLCANACFVTREQWPAAMPRETFKSFYNDFRYDAEKTHKRFALLVTQGSSQRRQMSRSMVWDSRDPEQRLHTLAVLGILDNRVLLRDAVRPVLHCLGAHDALVHVAAAGPLADSNSRAAVAVHPQASHALPLEQPMWLAQQIAEFVEANHD